MSTTICVGFGDVTWLNSRKNNENRLREAIARKGGGGDLFEEEFEAAQFGLITRRF